MDTAPDTESTSRGTRKDRRWWRFLVHKSQRRYALWLGLVLFVYSIMIFGFAFFAPYVIPAMTLMSSVPLADRANAAAQFLVLSQTVVPAIVVLVLGGTFFSVYLTKRLAGPLYRLEQIANELRQGNLALRVKFRAGDQLDGLGESMNEALLNLNRAFVEIRGREASGRAALSRVLTEMRSDPSANPQRLEQVELAVKEGEGIGEVIKRFRLLDAS